MVADEAILWVSLVLLAIGYNFHRMGPSFVRSRFGFPLALLGVTSFVLLPESLADTESELHGAILTLFKWVILFLFGAFIVLRSSSTYGGYSTSGMLLGWTSILASWAIAYLEFLPVSMPDTIRSLFSLLGILLGFSLVYVGASIFERSVGLESYSDPLSNEEGELVRTILHRRLGGDGHGN